MNSNLSPRRDPPVPAAATLPRVWRAQLLALIGLDAVTGLLVLVGAPGAWWAGVFLLLSAAWLFYLAIWRDA